MREQRYAALKTLDQPKIRQEILLRISGVRPDSPRRWGRMNARQMVCHLNDAFLCAMGEKQVSVDHNFKGRLLMKWGALYVPLRWPPGFATRPELDQEHGGTTPGEFEKDRQNLIALIERFTGPARDFSFRPHPMFREMSEWQWMRWGYLHTDHHLRQFGA